MLCYRYKNPLTYRVVKAQPALIINPNFKFILSNTRLCLNPTNHHVYGYLAIIIGQTKCNL
jgi:hypothetical protein